MGRKHPYRRLLLCLRVMLAVDPGFVTSDGVPASIFFQHVLTPLYGVSFWTSIRSCGTHCTHRFCTPRMIVKDGIFGRRSNAKNVLYLVSGDSCIILDQVPLSFSVFNCGSSDRSTCSGLILKSCSFPLEFVVPIKNSCCRLCLLAKCDHQSFKARLLH